MTDSFLKFKAKFLKIRILKSLLAGFSLGALVSGVCNALSRLAVFGFEPILSAAFGAGAFLVAAVVFFFLLGKSDTLLAEELDEEFSLNERVQTMVAFKDGEGVLLDMQRADADTVLGGIKTGAYKAKRLWVYLTVFVISAAVLACSFLTENLRDRTEPEPIVPFELSATQEASLNELISSVEKSDMQEPYRTSIADALKELLATLREVRTEPDMRAALAESMAYITDATYDSSSSAEILNALWNNGNVYLKHLAKALDTDEWRDGADWGAFAEGVMEYKAAIFGETTDDEAAMKITLTWALDASARNIKIALSALDIPEDDLLYAAVANIVNSEKKDAEGYILLQKKIEALSYASAQKKVSDAVDALTEELYSAVSTLKTNTNVGENVMTKLATLFLVPLPEFERPDFVKNRETIDGGTEEDKDSDKAPSDGGLGEGATFGSKDLVLDPLTGNYVEYGVLINTYNALMNEKLENGSYTEEQKEAIKNYFSLLYSGIKKEGN